MLGTRPLLHVCTDVLDASVLKMELRQCLEVDVKAVQRPSIEIYHLKKHRTLTIVWPLIVFLMRQGPCVGTWPLLHVCTDVLETSVLKRELKLCLEFDVKAVQRPSIEFYNIKKIGH